LIWFFERQQLKERETMQTTIEQAQAIISKWAEDTFLHDRRGIALHAVREAAALALAAGASEIDVVMSTAYEIGRDRRPASVEEKTADVAILTLSMAGHQGFALDEAIAAKHAVNVNRQWAAPDAQGVAQHVRRDGKNDPFNMSSFFSVLAQMGGLPSGELTGSEAQNGE
jgi:hypothetical protein